MGGGCPYGQYWDFLIKGCLNCHTKCKEVHASARCSSYCESVKCKALFGHYYDGLLKKCVLCYDVCGRHPAECSQHCQTPPSSVTTKTLTTHVPKCSWLSAATALTGSTIVFYSLLTLCMVLLLASFSLAFMTFQRRARRKISNPQPKEENHNHECVIKPVQRVGQPGGQPRQSSKDFATNASRPADREPSDDSSPTETCVCVHCFPDLKALGQGNDRPLRAPYSQAVHHGTLIQNGGPIWTEENLYTSEQGVQVEAAVG
ncbi:tumor necrosis factor receptor superfamily member 13B [Pempheris klunzingeri]|uniref:tumor necrosis factor receptor superfamily member 13B n=1 Tax=Pempheris klunzingeri TaxID=3127111 RepID=UPI00397F4EBF